jgi:hypothetical protein
MNPEGPGTENNPELPNQANTAPQLDQFDSVGYSISSLFGENS